MRSLVRLALAQARAADPPILRARSCRRVRIDGQLVEVPLDAPLPPVVRCADCGGRPLDGQATTHCTRCGGRLGLGPRSLTVPSHV